MSHQNLTAIPEIIVKGTAVDYRRTYGEFPANDGWALALILSGPPPNFTKAFSADVASFTIALANADTGGLGVGNYFWEERATKTGKSYPAASGVLQVAADLATAVAGSLQTKEAKMLAALDAAIDIRFGIGAASSQDVIESYAIGIRQFDKWKTREMLDTRATLARIVKSQANPGKMGPQVAVHFSGVNSEPGVPWAPRE